MSLQVWLPLNREEIRNQGLADVTITNSGATYTSTEGKIGGSYYFNGSSRIQTTLPSAMTTIKNTTVAAWVKSTSSTLALGGISHDSTPDYYAPGCTLYSSGWQTGTGSSWAYVSGGTVANTSVWHHVACVIDNTDVTTYLDGVQVATKTLAAWGMTSFDLGSGHFIEIGSDFPGGNEYLTGYINDFRVYNNALSAKEVKKLSQGLVLHYPLTNQYIESTTNLVTTEDGLSNTCYNGATSKYGYGTNTDMYKTLGTFEGRKSTKVYMGTAGLSAYPYVYFDNFNAAGTTIQTLSFYYFPTLQNTIIPYSYNGSYNFSYKTDKASGSATNVSQIIIPVDVGRWNYITITAQKYDTTNTSRGIGYIRIGSTSHTSTTSNYWLFNNVQVEAKDHATGYAGVGGTRTSTFIYDSSGFGNHGTISGALTISTNTPKYHVSTYFNGSSYFQSKFNTNLSGDLEFTVSFWIKADAFTNDYASVVWNGYSGTNSAIAICIPSGRVSLDFWNNRYLTDSVVLTANNWHHVCCIKQAGAVSTSNSHIYINGQEVTATANNYSTTAPNIYGSYKWIIGRLNDTSSRYITGKVSDIRVYATALSAEDVLALYNNKNF